MDCTFDVVARVAVEVALLINVGIIVLNMVLARRLQGRIRSLDAFMREVTPWQK